MTNAFLTPPVKYVGTKEVLATPMTLGEYNLYQGWTIPADQDPETAGYLVEYLNGGASNHPDHAGYISWSPADVFNESYTDISTPKARVIVERNELAVRFEGLKATLLNDRPAYISPAQWANMIEQHAHMRSYLATLEQRIYLFDTEV